MNVYEFLQLSKFSLETMLRNNIDAKDVEYIDLYREYLNMRRDGVSTKYITEHLTERYHISERKLFYLVKDFAKELS